MSNFQIHELSTGALDRDSYIVHDSEVSGNFQTRKDTAGAVADLALEVVASEYDDTASYTIGSYCIYSGVLYRCTTATTGAFDVSDWTAVLITGEYKRVRVMHKADFDLLTPEEQADGMIFVDDVDITADDISYSSGVSVADKLDTIPTLVSDTVSVSSGVTANKVQLLKYGNVVFLTMAIKVSSPSSWQVIGTIPSAYFPRWSIFGVMINTTSASNLQTAHINVEPDGRIRLANTLPDSRDTYTFELMWIIE